MERMIVNLKDVDITDTPEFEEYSDFKEMHRFEYENHQFPRTYFPPEIKNQQTQLVQALRGLPPETLKRKADELISAQKLDGKYEDLISTITSDAINNFDRQNTMKKPMFWASHEDHSPAPKIKVGNQTVDAFDLDYAIAESLQQLYSSEDPRAEYYGWVERQKQIEVDIATDGTTEDEIVERNSFIYFLDERETEMKRVMTLYSGAALNTNSRHQVVAQEKLEFLVFKLSELRRLRERTASTKSHADSKEQLDARERQRQREAVAITAGLAATSLTAEMMSPGNRKLYKDNSTELFERGPAESIVSMRPITRTVEQAFEKIETSKKNRDHMRSLFAAMRNGMSKEEWEKMQKQGDRPASEQVRSSVNKRRSNFLSRFREYTNDVTS